MNNFIIRLFSSSVLGISFVLLIVLNNIYFNISLLAIFILALFEIMRLKNNIIKISIFIIVIVFIFSFYSLRSMPDGIFLVLWCLSITWITDSSAYIFGKLFGKKKIGFVSPNKTYFGIISGIIFSQFSFFFINLFFNKVNFLNLYKITLIQFLISISVIIGDLFFSFLKRKLQIKDYSKLIPGHGGILDRIDGLIFSIIIFNLLFQL